MEISDTPELSNPVCFDFKDKDIGAPKYIKPLPVAVTDVNACSEKYGFKDLQRLMAQNGMTYTGKYDACRKLLAKGVKL